MTSCSRREVQVVPVCFLRHQRNVLDAARTFSLERTAQLLWEHGPVCETHMSQQKAETAPRTQVSSSIYFTSRYLTPGRFASYACQISEIMALPRQTVLEIGIGNGIIAYLARRAGVQITTLDIDPLLEPDMVGSVTDVPVESDAFDVVACFEVLEHLPFDLFPTVLRELHRVARRYALISLPDITRYVRASVHLPGVGDLRFMTQSQFLPNARREFLDAHCWEIGDKRFPLSRVVRCIESEGFAIHRTYRIFDHPYHRVFVLGKIP